MWIRVDVDVVVDADADADDDDAQPNGTSTRARWVFGFQRLDVYRCAIEFLAVAVKLAEQAPRGYGSLSDQLRRAALSVPLNIAEGSGKTTRDGAHFYTIARRSALECAATLDVLEALGAVRAEDLAHPRALLERIVSMLTKLRST